MAYLLSNSIRVLNSAELYKASKPSKFANENRGLKSKTSPRGRGPVHKTQKLNLEVSPHRAVSAVRLMRIEFGGAFADLLNENGKGSGDNEMGYVERTLGFRSRALDDRDLRLVTDIVGGTIRWRRYLDHLILALCHDENTFRSMEPLLLQILRIGFYEIVKLEMPSYAVVDENVRLAKVALRPGAGNMVNGVLRKLVLLKENNSLPLPTLEGNDRAQARALATLYSHPVLRKLISLLQVQKLLEIGVQSHGHKRSFCRQRAWTLSSHGESSDQLSLINCAELVDAAADLNACFIHPC